MKMTTRLLIFLFALCLCGCKTKQKVTENLIETAQASCSSVQLTTEQTEQEGQATSQEETMHTQWSDSIVERFHERVVTDSTGRVLLHEVEHSKDTYKGRGQHQAKRTDNRQEKATVQSQELTIAKNDSTYNGGSLNEVTVVKNKTWRWLWYVGIVASLLMLGCIILKVIRR